MRSQLGRFLRSPQAWPVLEQPLDEAAYEALLHALLDALVGAGLLVDVAEKGPRGVQLRCDALLWCAGDGSAATIDPIRSRCMREIAAPAPRVNTFFQHLNVAKIIVTHAQRIARLACVDGVGTKSKSGFQHGQRASGS